MARIKPILQNLNQNDSHYVAVNGLLSTPNLDGFLFGLAYVRRSGVSRISRQLENVAAISVAYVGIRNGVTSAQGLSSLLDVGVTVYLVDTAATDIVYHPKIYAGYNKEIARVLMGSANLTLGGLANNIEASSEILLDRQDSHDEEFFRGLNDTLSALPVKYPHHVVRLVDSDQIENLLEEGRLEDESFVRAPSTVNTSQAVRRDVLGRIPVKGFVHPPPPNPQSQPIVANSASTMVLVWESNPLSERDLTIPSGSNTNPTGSMGFKKGRLVGIDQRHYFREVIFAGLTWSFDTAPRTAHYERAHADFNFRIKGIDFGWFNLKLSHNSKTDSKAYNQNNWMSQIHWGPAKPLIAQTDLLGRILRLYAHDTSTSFTIEID